MKFGKTFETHLTIEWRQQYMRYTDLKTLIRRGVDGAPTESETTPDQLLEYYASFEEHFFAECQHELTRVNNFFLEKMAEARRKHGTLKLQLLATAHATGHVSRSHTRSQNQSRSHSQLPSPRASVVSMPSTSSNRKLMTQRQLRSAYTEFYLTLVLLQNFQSLNETGFRKICKKYDKYLKSNHGALWLERHLTYIAFVDRRPLQQMTIEVEELYTHYLAAGDRAKAMTKLRVPPLGEPTPPPMVFRAGLALGMFIMLALAALFSYLRRPPITDNIEAFMRLYRGPFTWVIFNFFMAANVAGWQRAGVNHVLIFEIDPRSHLQPATFLEIACTFGMLWTLSMLGFLFHDLINVTDPFVFPLALTLIMITLLINPLPIMNWPARWWTMRLVGRVITAPLHYVGFADFWMGDQMNSLVTCMADYYYIVRFYAVCWLRYSNVNSCFDEDMFVPISRCLPAWFRFAQCLRRFSDSGSKSLSYLLNAGKYSTTFFVVFFSTMRGRTDVSCRWLCEYVLQSLHVVLHHQLHRVERVQLSVGCVQGLWHLSDLAGRAFVPPGEARLSAVLLLLCHPRESRAASLLGHRVRCALPQADHALQYQDLRQHPGDNALSRFIWNYIRLENEHLNNCGHFRATRDIHLAALNPTQERMLEHMMTDPERRPDERQRLGKQYF
ncbi:xenotropic and polytropic retrovirus receptor 1 homolog isoform X1 [Drosophila albomicans]|uniref:Xenotropic and polytropic retrovirus receptor 1 homolog isoform X1 n=1 Tax=Drosophila albomicans TaxID=7291 RepID=A0A6P8XZ17_DROAB|nr:xenotropic and polytropic retrovirus receptor 1 homolog isoform X1 [Drosophila albomicans]